MSYRVTKRSLTVALLAIAILLVTAGTALAATGEPTMGLAALQAKLDASPTGGITGYFKTVLKGSTIETIPVEVLAITGETDPSSSLILFEAQGDKIAKLGGIVAGMSGSPIYVDDNGVDKVIGAVSYGDYFTLGGSGLATPIDAMLKIATDYAPRVQTLSAPVLMDGRVVDKVVVSSTPTAQGSGTFVAKPLASVFIGGLKPTSALYTDLASRLAKKGVSVIAIDSALSAGTSSFSTDLVPGAAIGTLATRGGIWVGGLGTVTYADGSTVLAYGHPGMFTGASDMYMTNAWISGVWPSSYESYKIGYPTAVRGTITQDRSAGVMGVLDTMPAEAPVVSHAIDTESGRETTVVSYFASDLLDAGRTSVYVYDAVALAPERLFDQSSTPGSADITTTVVVSDGTRDYTVVMRDLIDDSYDLPSAIGLDADNAVTDLLSVLQYGLEKPHIVSVSLDAAVTTARREAHVVRVDALAPLQYGDNRVRVSLLAYGTAATQTVDTTLVIPYGTPLTGTLSAAGVSSTSDTGDYPGVSDPTSFTRQRLSDVAAELNETLPYNTIVVSFMPSDSGSGSDTSADESDTGTSAGASTDPIETTATAAWSIDGAAKSVTTEILPQTETVSYGSEAMIFGQIDGPEVPVKVYVYAISEDGEHESLLGTGIARPDSTGTLSFSVFTRAMRANTELRVHVDGGDGFTPADAEAYQEVRASARVTASLKTIWWRMPITLTAHVVPGRSNGSVKFQYYDPAKKVWRTIGTRSLKRGTSEAKASLRWTPPRGKRKVRVVYGGGFYNAGTTSGSITITRH